MRLVRVTTVLVVIALIVMTAIHIMASFLELVGLSLSISIFDRDLFSTDKIAPSRGYFIYHAASAASYMIFTWVAFQILSMLREATRETNIYKRNARRLLVIVAGLAVAEGIRSTVKVLVMDEGISPSNIAAYGAIICLSVLAVIMLRGLSTRQYYDGSI